MSALHSFVHTSLQLSSSFLLALIALSVVSTIAGLLFADARRLSAASRHTILAAALLFPLVAGALAAVDLRQTLRSLFPPVQNAAGSMAVIAADVAAVRAQPAQSEVLCVIAAAWAAMAIVRLFLLLRSWLRWSAIARRGEVLDDPRLLGLLQRMARAGRRLPRLRVSADAAEPMVVGLVRPSILLPVGYAGALSEEEIAAVFAHESEHIRRRDNLTGALLEVVGALFWFDPTRLIARRRLLDLRERACDEYVLESGCDTRSYLAALAKSGHAAVESPAVACMSGFHVRERMEAIMSYRIQRAAFVSPSLIRVTVAITAILFAVTFGVVAPSPAVASSDTTAKTATDTAARPISLNLKDAEIHDLLATFSALTGRQIVADPDVQGKVTIDVVGVPWDQALVRVLTQVQATTVREGDKIRVVKRRSGSVPPPPPGYFNVGGDVTAPVIVKRVDPIYPAEARTAGITGVVILRALIGANGRVERALILKPLPMGLSDAALEAVRQWEFTPATRNGQPVPVVFHLTISFKLTDE